MKDKIKDNVNNWISTIIRIITLFPFVGSIYLYTYMIFSKIYNISIFQNIKSITFSFGDVMQSILVFMAWAILIMPYILMIIIGIFSMTKEGVAGKIPPYNRDKCRGVWDAILLVVSLALFVLLLYYKKIKFINSHLIYLLFTMLVINWLLFASLNRHLEFYQNKCLSACSDTENKYAGIQKICLSLKDFYKTYLLVMIFIYPIPHLNKMKTLDNISTWLIFIQIILITKFICDKNSKEDKSIINIGLIISGILVPLFLAIVEQLLGIK